jgi:uncharacterized protein
MNGYRKDDLCYLSWDYPVGAYFARNGYAVAKVDLRGTGDRGGVVPEAEYSEQELSDGVEIINQLSRKEWSNGKVGMHGLSWGGVQLPHGRQAQTARPQSHSDRPCLG